MQERMEIGVLFLSMQVFEPMKVLNLIVISLFSGLSGIGVVLCVVTGGDGNEKDDRRIMGRRDQSAGHPDFK